MALCRHKAYKPSIDVGVFPSLPTRHSAYNSLCMTNRLRQIREMRGLSVSEVARAFKCDRGEIYKLEDGRRELSAKWIRRLAKVYDVAPRDLVSGFSVRINAVCYTVVNEAVAKSRQLREVDFIEAPNFVADPQHCAGFIIADDSADRLNYPPGTSGIYRVLSHLTRPLQRGDTVVARHFSGRLADNQVIETVVGLLDITVNGDIVIALQTSNRRLGAAITVRAAPPGVRVDVPRGGAIAYAPEPGDNAEILGVVESVTMPVHPPNAI